MKAIHSWIALCIFCAALSLSGSSLLPLPPKTISGKKRRLYALIVAYSELRFCRAVGVSEGKRRKDT